MLRGTHINLFLIEGQNKLEGYTDNDQEELEKEQGASILRVGVCFTFSSAVFGSEPLTGLGEAHEELRLSEDLKQPCSPGGDGIL